MKLISWNVNGLRACLTHDFAASFAALDADVFSVQETKMQPGQADFAPEGYTEYTYSAEKKGYSGTACWCKTPPLRVTTGIGREEHDHEGRVLTLEYPGFYLVNCYTPNSQDGLKRLDYRMTWEDDFRAYLLGLDAKKPVILCGDLNVAHQEIDIKNAKTNRMSAGFTDQERAKMTELLAAGFTDSFRAINENFGRVFTELFGGGEASLVLEDESDVLACGIGIRVAPPGKVIKNLEALSGGEQALVAISIYFAILAVNPAPFCILDEIEAALDDANVVRFAQYLRRVSDKTQFIVITHRRGTMEAANVLYGVTMQEDGVSKLLKLDLEQVDAEMVS